VWSVHFSVKKICHLWLAGVWLTRVFLDFRFAIFGFGIVISKKMICSDDSISSRSYKSLSHVYKYDLYQVKKNIFEPRVLILFIASKKCALHGCGGSNPQVTLSIMRYLSSPFYFHSILK